MRVVLRIGVELADALPGPGELVADARALEAAGVDSLWVGASGTLDPWTRLGALAATTHRMRIGVSGIDPAAWPAARLAAIIETLARLSGDRLVVGVETAGDASRLRPIVPARVPVVLVHSAGGPDRRAGADPTTGEEGTAALERWSRVPSPNGRSEWAAVRVRHAELGVTGILVPMDPRLLDLLRNPDVEDDRSDLRIAVG